MEAAIKLICRAVKHEVQNLAKSFNEEGLLGQSLIQTHTLIG